MITKDRIEVKEGDKVWSFNQNGWSQSVIGQPYTHNPNFICQARYCYFSKDYNGQAGGIVAELKCGQVLKFPTTDTEDVHNALAKMGLKYCDEDYKLRYDRGEK